jgi:hypothetical protein
VTTPLEPYGELFIVDDWVPVTDYIRGHGVGIERGYEGENASPRPSSFDSVFNDPDGRWNRRNPMGPYFGQLGKNMPFRFGVDVLSDAFARTETNTWGAVGNAAGDTWTNGSSSGGTVNATDWTVSGGTARHSLPADGAYRVSELSKTDRLFVDSELLLSDITVPTSNVTGTGALASEIWFRVQDVLNFTAVSLAYQIDETLLVAIYERTAGVNRYLLGYTAIPGLSLSSTVNYHLMAQAEGSVLRAKVWPAGDPEPRDWHVSASRATIREGYLAVASYAFTGNTNSKPLVFQYGGARVRIPLSATEIPNLGKRTDDASMRSKKVLVRAGGIMQRLGQGNPPVLSPMVRQRAGAAGWATVGSITSVESVGSYSQVKATDADVADDAAGYRYYIQDKAGERKEDTLFTITGFSSSGGFTTVTFSPDALEPIETGDKFTGHRLLGPADAPIVFWPCDDGRDSTAIASALPGGQPMTIRYATPDFASEDRFKGIGPVMRFNNAEVIAPIPDYDNSAGAVSVVFVVSFPDSDEAASGQDLVQFLATGTGFSYDIQYEATGGGSFELVVFNIAGTVLFTSSVDFALRGGAFQVTYVLRQTSPTTVTYQVFVINAEGTVLTSSGPHTVTGVTTLGKLTRIAGNPGGGYIDVGFGALMVLPTQMSSNLNLFDDFMGRGNEVAQHRLQRLCEEEGIPFSYRSDKDIVTSRVGVQESGVLLDLLEDPPKVDLGLLYEPKGALGIEYCTRGALSNQEPFLTLSMADGEILPEWAPEDDDRYLRNYIKVTRTGGSSAIAEETEGPLSTADYPDGAGRYTGGGTINVGTDIALEGQAWWRLHLGTVDEDRIAKLKVMPTSGIPLERLFSVNIGYRIVITDAQAADVYDDISLIVLGYSLTFDTKYNPTFVFNCVPESPYRILTWDDTEYGRLDGTDSVLDEDLTTTETDLTVSSESGHWLWTTDATDFPFDIKIGGEVMTVTNITGTTSPQTFTVTRSINGVVKEHDTGDTVELARPVYYGL